MWPVAVVLAAVLIAAGIVWFAVQDGSSSATGVETAATAGPGKSKTAVTAGSEEPGPEASEDGEALRESTSPEAEAQAKVLDSLLVDSRGSRSGLGAALEQLRSCDDTGTGLATVRRVTDARREQVVQVKALDTDTLEDGDAVKERLTRALTASFSADEAFLAWATRQDAECDAASTGDEDYQRGLVFSGEATAAKRSFLKLWNPLAQRFGLPERAEHEI